MIAKAIAYTASDGKVYPSLAEAQAVELHAIFKDGFTEQSPGELDFFCKLVVTHKDAVVNVLTTTPTSRPSRRRANGYPGNKKRKSSAAGSTALNSDSTAADAASAAVST